MNLHLRLSTAVLGLTAFAVVCTNPPTASAINATNAASAADAADAAGASTNWQTQPGQSSLNFVATKAVLAKQMSIVEWQGEQGKSTVGGVTAAVLPPHRA